MGRKYESRRGVRSGGKPSARSLTYLRVRSSSRGWKAGTQEPRVQWMKGRVLPRKDPSRAPVVFSNLAAARRPPDWKTWHCTSLPSSGERVFFRPIIWKGRARLRGLRQLSIGVLVRQYVGRLARARRLEEKSSAWPPALEGLSTFVLFFARWWPPAQLAASAASLPPGRSAAQVRPGQNF